MLIARDMSPMKAVVWSVLCILALDLCFGKQRLSLPRNFFGAIDRAMRSLTSIAVACACSGTIVGVISLTGLGLKFSTFMHAASAQSIWLALFLTMAASLVLGCGLPTTAAYIVLATLAVPALSKLGVPLLSAHLFVFYFGCISTITPPVALSAYAAGAIAEANPNKVGWTAFKFGLVSFIIPYMWIADPGLLLQGSIFGVIQVIVTSVTGVTLFANGLQGFAWTNCSWYQRILALLSELLLIEPGLTTDLIGLCTFTIFAVLHYLTRCQAKRAAAGCISQVFLRGSQRST